MAKNSTHSSRSGTQPIPQTEQRLEYTDSEIPTNPRSREPVGCGEMPANLHNILRYIGVNQGVNSTGLCRFFGKSSKVIFRYTAELRYRQFIVFLGSLRDGGYFLLPAGLEFLKNPESDTAFSPRPMSADLVCDFIAKNPGANHFDIAAHFHRTIKAANRHTVRLRKKKKIVFKGSAHSGGFYVVVPRKKSDSAKAQTANTP